MARHHRFYQRIVSQLTLVIAICLGNRSQKIYLIANVMTKLFVVTLAMDLLAILKKNLNRTMLWGILKNFRMCTILIEALTPLDRTSRIKLYKNNARSRLFCRIAKRSINLSKYCFCSQKQNRKIASCYSLTHPVKLACFPDSRNAGYANVHKNPIKPNTVIQLKSVTESRLLVLYSRICYTKGPFPLQSQFAKRNDFRILHACEFKTYFKP